MPLTNVYNLFPKKKKTNILKKRNAGFPPVEKEISFFM
jgi:hypothetical protein